MKLVTGVVVGAAGGALIGYLVAGQLSTARGNPNAAVIVMSGAAGSPCTAKVDPFRIGNKRNLKVHWAIDNEDAPCKGNGDWRIELRFDNAADGTVWNNGVIRLNQGGGPPFKIPTTANIGKFPYHVWFVRPDGSAYEMADPELQIEM